MAIRPILVSLGMLAAFAGTILLLWPSRAATPQSVQYRGPSGFPIQSFDFSYQSQSYFNPALPGTKASGQGLTIACESRGLMHLGQPTAATFSMLFEFTHVLCGGANLITERGLARTVHYTREFLTSHEAVQRATEDPALAIVLSLFLHMDLGLRAAWPESKADFVLKELRLEGETVPALDWLKDQGEVQWTKKFSGVLPADDPAVGLTQSLQYQVGGRSEESEPIEWGLLQLDGREQIVSMQKKNLVARTDIEVRLRRAVTSAPQGLRQLWVETKADIAATAPRMFSAEEKEALLQRWRKFRDGEGQGPARGGSESNHDAYLELKQALRQDPSLAEDLAADFDAMEPDSSAFATLSGALIYSGEVEALQVFVAEAQKHKDEREWQERALPMVGLAPAPTQQSWKYLDAMRQQSRDPDLKTAAELGMATHLKRGYQDADFLAEIQRRMENASTEEARLHLLDLVGNAGLDEFFPIVASWLPGSTRTLRLRLGQALRFMPRPEAETLLLQLAAESDLDVALVSLQSLRDRTVTSGSIPALLQLLTRHTDDRIRLKVLENLYEARHQDADLLPKIQRLRSGLTFGPALTEAWEQLEKDWVDPVET